MLPPAENFGHRNLVIWKRLSDCSHGLSFFQSNVGRLSEFDCKIQISYLTTPLPRSEYCSRIALGAGSWGDTGLSERKKEVSRNPIPAFNSLGREDMSKHGCFVRFDAVAL